jgi:hypothetical protein
MKRATQQDVVHTLRTCAEEIRKLRQDNQILFVENRAYDRLLSALENHRPSGRTEGMCEDQAWRASKLADQVAQEMPEEPVAHKPDERP